MTNADKNQPLYVPPAERVSLEDLKQRAEQVQDLASTKGKKAVHELYEKDVTRAALVAVGVVVVAASLAYMMGSRAARRAMSAGLE
jgi:hypothetical protein